ncbi:MAG TPA: hypothetical protein VFF65_06940 [Phycisphaerales bacterium]|nr:hypothetical protein [Phycisphaerales bacterium]
MRTAIASVLFACTAGVALGQTGNPIADGWLYAGGNSHENGTYVQGAARMNYGTYATTFTLGAGSPLLSSTAGFQWNIGDTILGIGGVFTVTAPTAAANGWGSYSSTVDNADRTGSMRIVAKFGTSPTSFGPSTVAPMAGNGASSFSGGAGGAGSILINNTVGTLLGTPSGQVRLPDQAQIYTGSGVVNIDVNYGRLVYVHNGTVASSFEALINLTLLQSNIGMAYGDLPQYGDRHDVALQRSTNASVDALVLPSPGAAAALGLGAVAGLRRRRR